MKIGIMGGTFNPIHLGHIEMAEYCLKEFDLDKIMFLPVGDAPHKDNVVPKNIRVEMVETAIKDNKNFFLSRIEVDRVGKTYSFNTLTYLKEHTSDDYYFIIGGDTVNTLNTWYRYSDVIKMTEFLCILRTGVDISEKLLQLKKDGAKIIVATHTGLNISSTEIRDKVKNGQPICNDVGKNVAELIEKYGLYKD